MSLNIENGREWVKTHTLIGLSVDNANNNSNIKNILSGEKDVKSVGSNLSLRDISRMRKQKIKDKVGVQSPNDTSIKKLLMCDTCNTALIANDGYMVCRSCGICQSRDIDTGQEWRNLDDNKGSDPCRVSLPNNTLMPETSVGTMVAYGGCGGGNNGSNGNNKNSQFAHIIRTMNNWSMLSYKDSTILKRFKHITSVCKNAGILDSIIEEIKIVYFKISHVKAARRNKLQALMAVSVIIGHRIAGYERDYKDVADMFDIDLKILRSMIKEYEFIWKELQDIEEEKQAELVKKSISNDTKNSPSVIETKNNSQSDDIIDKLVMNEKKELKSKMDSNAKMDEEIFKQRQEQDNARLKKYIIKLGISPVYYEKFYDVNNWIAERYILAQHIPKSKYACLIYLISELYALNIDKHKIVSLCETSNVTINKCYNKLTPYMAEIIDYLDIKSMPVDC